MTNRKDWLPACSTSWDKPCAEVYRSLAEVGIHHVELCGKSPAFWQEMDFVHRAKDVVANMKQYGVAPSSMHLPFSPSAVMDPTDADADKRDAIVRLDGELLRAAADAGIPIAVIHPSCEPYRASERGERMKYSIDTLHRIAAIAQSCGVKLAVENLPRTCLGNIHEEIRLILNEIPSLYACFDMNHSLRQPNPDFIRAVGNRIITVHASDYDMVDERHLLPFLGRNDWAAIMQALEDVDYSGFFTFELSWKGVLTTQNLRMAYDKLMEI